jgi:DNA (cytosine-5)-methyltransferase 1
MDVLHESMRENDQVLRAFSHGSHSSPYKPLRVENIVKSDMSAGMTAGVYYATYGHWTISLLQAGYDVQWHVQPNIKNFNLKDAFANNILLNNFPEIPIPSAKEFDRMGGLDDGVDIICGSPPCIGFSRGNPTSGADHPANKNFINMFEFIAYYQPKYYLVEMVPRILTIAKELVERALGKVGMYNNDYMVMEASSYGAAQVRKRVYFFGFLKSLNMMVSPPSTLFKRKALAIQEVLPKELIDKFDKYEPDGVLLRSNYTRDGKLQIGPYSIVGTPERRLSRTIKPDGQMFTITYASVSNCLHYSKERFLSVPEVKLLMGLPEDYWLPDYNAQTQSKCIASGVDIRFASYLLRHIANEVGRGQKQNGQ